jgi:hypothetical protein
MYWIWISHGTDFKEYYFLRCDTMQSHRVYRCFRITYCLQLHGWRVSQAINWQEVSRKHSMTIWHHFPEDTTFHIHRFENLKSKIQYNYSGQHFWILSRWHIHWSQSSLVLCVWNNSMRIHNLILGADMNTLPYSIQFNSIQFNFFFNSIQFISSTDHYICTSANKILSWDHRFCWFYGET